MNYHKITTCDVANGPGIRVVLWTSGCDHHCKNCHNPETWDKDSGKPFDKKAVDKILVELSHEYIAGLTLSGGDPLFPSNRDTILGLVKEVKNRYPQKSIWLYTGYRYEQIKGEYLLDYVDVIVDGPYVDSLRDVSLPYCGSSNQRVIDVKESKESQTIVLWKSNI